MTNIKLFKRCALGIYEFELILTTTLKGQIITCVYGVYDGKKITNIISGDIKKFNSLVTKKKKEGYRTAEEIGCSSSELNYPELDYRLGEYTTDADGYNKPMKCKPFVTDSFNYEDGAIGQPKINGNRGTITWGVIQDGLFTKEGTVLKSHDGDILKIDHISRIFDKIFEKESNRKLVFDGEYYVFGEPVTSISGACRNPRNPIHSKLTFHSFDLAIPDVDQTNRLAMKHQVFKRFEKPGEIYCQKSIYEHANINGLNAVVS